MVNDLLNYSNVNADQGFEALNPGSGPRVYSNMKNGYGGSGNATFTDVRNMIRASETKILGKL